jgi:hypothetical protein
MKTCDYRHCLAGLAVLATLLYVVPEYGILLSISTLIVLLFAGGVGLLALLIYGCERSAEELSRMKKEVRPAQVKSLY